MKINKENREEIFLDYIEGNLTAHEKAEVESFVLLHPEFQEELDILKLTLLSDAEPVFPKKELLKKDYLNDEVIIAWLEGDLNADDQNEFKKNLNRSELARNVELFEKARLYPDSISYPFKNRLKKKSVIIKLALPLSIAASLLLMMFYLGRETENTPQRFKVSEIPVVKKNTSIERTLQAAAFEKPKERKFQPIKPEKIAEKVAFIETKKCIALEVPSIEMNPEARQLPDVAFSKSSEPNLNETVIDPVQWIKKKIFTELPESIGMKDSVKSKKTLAMRINSLAKATGLDFNIETKADSTGAVVFTGLKAGSFEFSRK